MKFKLNDKVRIKKKLSSYDPISSYYGRECKVISLTGKDGEKNYLTVDIPHNRKPENNLYVEPSDIEYFHLEPLKELLDKIPKKGDNEYSKIKHFLDREYIEQQLTFQKPLNDRILKSCRKLWEKYNK